LLSNASRLALMSGYDFGVAVTCAGGGATLGHSTSVFVGRNSGLVTLAHEFNHAVTGMEDIYSLDCFAVWDEAYCELADGSRTYCCQVDGYAIPDGHTGTNCSIDQASGEVTCSQETKICTQGCQCSIYRRPDEPNPCLETNASGQYVIAECDWDCCRNTCAANCQNGVVYSGPDGRIWHPASSGFWVNAWLPADGLTYVMDIPDGPAFPHKWMRLGNTVQHCSGDVFSDGYLNLLASPMFLDPSDPEGLLVSGVIHAGGKAEFDPFVVLPETYLDIDPGEPGSYEILLRGRDGSIRDSYGFTPRFYQTDPDAGPVNEVPFAFRIAWHQDTSIIELRSPSGEVIASRIVSSSEPEIKLEDPNGGEIFQQGNPIEIRWEATDADLDQLAFSLFISSDAGLSWVPLAIDLTRSRFSLETTSLDLGESYLVRILATDGVNTAYDISDAVFTIAEEVPVLPLWLTIAGGVVALAIIAVLIAVGVLWMLRSRRTAN
jgi:hypothetical protein